MRDRDYLKELNRRLKHFCQNAPVPLAFKTTPYTLYLYGGARGCDEWVEKFEIDFSLTPWAMVREVKGWLERTTYPHLHQFYSTTMGEEEIGELLEEGEDGERLALNSQNESVVRWQVVGVKLKRDRFTMRNIETGELWECSMRKMPVSAFLYRIRTASTAYESWVLFERECQFLRRIAKHGN